MLGLGFPISLIFLAVRIFPQRASPAAAALLVLAALALLLLVLPLGRKRSREDDTPRGRIDERDIMFSRRLLEPGSARFDEYYAANPEKRAPDDAFGALPGLPGKGASQHQPYSFAAADACFVAVEAFADSRTAKRRVEPPARLSRCVDLPVAPGIFLAAPWIFCDGLGVCLLIR